MQIKRWETLEGFDAVAAYVTAKDEFHDFRLGNIEWRGEQLRIAIEGDARVWFFTFTGVSELEFDMDCVLPAYVTEMEIKGHHVLLGLDNGWFSFRAREVTLEIPRREKMGSRALVVIELQNGVTENYKEIIGTVNAAIDWAQGQGITVVYIKHDNPYARRMAFRPGMYNAELVPELKVVSEYIFTKTRGSALNSEDFTAFIQEQELTEFFLVGADAAACLKSTCSDLAKDGCTVHVFSDGITSYDKEKIPEALAFYKSKGCLVERFRDRVG